MAITAAAAFQAAMLLNPECVGILCHGNVNSQGRVQLHFTVARRAWSSTICAVAVTATAPLQAAMLCDPERMRIHGSHCWTSGAKRHRQLHQHGHG